MQTTTQIQFKVELEVEVEDGDGDIIRVNMVKKVFNSQMMEVFQGSDSFPTS